MKKPVIVKLPYQAEMSELEKSVDHKILATWASDCAERVLHYFEKEYPDDMRPRQAIKTLRKWIDDGIFSMPIIRGASLGSHAAARQAPEFSPARAAARAAGQAVATAHVRTHAKGGAMYALTAIRDAGGTEEEIQRESEWQYRHLLELKETGV
ncbi:MAG: putative immunity protein [Weeksellaceae bacterium]